jgi:hypothetical protein
MNLKRTSVLLLAAALFLGLVAAACQPAGPAPTTVVRDYYEALNSEDIDAAMGYIAPEAVFINPTGTYEGADAIRASLEFLAAENISFNLSNLRDTNGRVVYDYEVLVAGEVVETGTDGLTIVNNGKIVFDGTESSEP